MLTYQDLLAAGELEQERVQFVLSAVMQHKGTELYKTAKIAEDYDKNQNTTIMNFTKWLYTVSGTKVVDTYSTDYKLASNFFEIFITQENQYLLGNGISWQNSATADRLGKRFEHQVQVAGAAALVHGVSFGFWNNDRLDVFNLLEFVPFYDEENGSLRAGVRFWQIDDAKPLRATLYEEDGYTDYIWNKRLDADNKQELVGEILHDKRPYKLKKRTTEAEGTEIYDGENYPLFPIVPLWGNRHHQSELVGLREQIDAYDLIKSGACNSIEEASYVYWIISGAGGMDDLDHQKFLERMKVIHSYSVNEDQEITPHSVEAPIDGRETILKRIRSDLYEHAMALDTKEISGAATATEIRAAYEPLNTKVDSYEYCVADFLDKILAIAGIDDEASFTRSMLVNQEEEVQTVIQAAPYLDGEYVTRKVLQILGDSDKADEVLKQMAADELERGAMGDNVDKQIEGQEDEVGEDGKS